MPCGLAGSNLNNWVVDLAKQVSQHKIAGPRTGYCRRGSLLALRQSREIQIKPVLPDAIPGYILAHQYTIAPFEVTIIGLRW
jgi:hypothetical protein